MPTWRFIELRDLEPYRFHCMREALANSVGGGFSPNTLLLTQLAGEHVSIGRMAGISQMVQLDFCRRNGIPITRSFSPSRTSAFIDSNSIRCLAVATKSITEQVFYEAAVTSLRALGLEAEHIPKTNDIVVKGRKVSVCSVHPHGNSILFPWSIALDFNHDRAEQAILSPKDMREWVTTIKKELGKEVSVDELKGAVKQGFQQTIGITFEEGELSTRELSNIEELLPKYTSETWLKYGKWSPVKEYWRPE